MSLAKDNSRIYLYFIILGIINDNVIEVGYIDTKNDLSPERILQILQENSSIYYDIIIFDLLFLPMIQFKCLNSYYNYAFATLF